MTPRQIHLILTARRFQEERKRENCLLLARYAALAVHDPGRLPSLPRSAAPQTGEEMKQRLLAWRGKDPHDA